MKRSSTKGALFTSALALLLCFVMLLGTTFAWFTDEVTSTNNKIQAGTLEIDLLYKDVDATDYISVKELIKDGKDTAIFNYTNWEPGYVEAKHVKVETDGSLALKYTLKLVPIGEVEALADVIEVYYAPDTVNVDRSLTGLTKIGTLRDVLNGAQGTLLDDQLIPAEAATTLGETPDTYDSATIALKMIESAGNEYQGTKIGTTFDINLYATQFTYEEDSFDNKYDEDAPFDDADSTVIAPGATESATVEAANVSIEIPAAAGAGNYVLTVENSSVTTNDEGKYVANFDIELTKDGVPVVAAPGVEYTVTIKVANGITKDSVKVLHKGNEVPVVAVDTINGLVTIKTDSFSPYSVVYSIGCDWVKDEQTGAYHVYTGVGLEEINKMMVGKTAGKNVVVELGANIDMTGKTWTPVDSHADTAFSFAELNGNGYTISNLTINGQAMFRRFAGTGDVTVKNVIFNNATINSNSLNTSILTGQSYQNVLLDNVDVINSSITGTYKVAPLIATVYNEGTSTVTATLKNCDVVDTTVKATSYDFCTTGMVAFVYADDNDKIEFENCTVKNVKLIAPTNYYTAHAAIYTTGSESLYNEADGVTVENVTFEEL